MIPNKRMKSRFWQKIYVKKERREKKREWPCFNLQSWLARNVTKTELSFKSSFFPLFYDIFVAGTQTQGYKLVVKHVSHWYIKHVNSICGYFFQASTGLCSLVLWPYSYEILRESANLCVEILNSRRQTKGDLVTWYKFAFSVWHKREP